jgi:hypothetical protein
MSGITIGQACELIQRNPTVNPYTGKKIDPQGGTALLLHSLCEAYYQGKIAPDFVLNIRRPVRPTSPRKKPPPPAYAPPPPAARPTASYGAPAGYAAPPPPAFTYGQPYGQPAAPPYQYGPRGIPPAFFPTYGHPPPTQQPGVGNYQPGRAFFEGLGGIPGQWAGPGGRWGGQEAQVQAETEAKVREMFTAATAGLSPTGQPVIPGSGRGSHAVSAPDYSTPVPPLSVMANYLTVLPSPRPGPGSRPVPEKCPGGQPSTQGAAQPMINLPSPFAPAPEFTQPIEQLGTPYEGEATSTVLPPPPPALSESFPQPQLAAAGGNPFQETSSFTTFPEEGAQGIFRFNPLTQAPVPPPELGRATPYQAPLLPLTSSPRSARSAPLVPPLASTGNVSILNQTP